MRVGAAAIGVLALAQVSPDGPRVLRPRDKSAVAAGKLSIIARSGAPLLLDGKPVDAKRPGPGALAAEVHLAPGLHELSAGGQTIRFFAGPNPPAGFQAYRLHPPSGASCETCHAVRDGAWEFRGAETSCLGCHDLKKFPVTHTHNTEVLAECGLCHDPHGSTGKFHLKFVRETACKLCHG